MIKPSKETTSVNQVSIFYKNKSLFVETDGYTVDEEFIPTERSVRNMVNISFRNNPLIAAILGIAIIGLGHLYLKRWLRALAWIGITVVASVLFVPESTMAAIASGTLADPVTMLPIVLIGSLSVIDAYLIAKLKRTGPTNSQTTNDSTADETGTAVVCPACGKDVDPDLEFCHWCTTELKNNSAEPNQRTKDNTNK